MSIVISKLDGRHAGHILFSHRAEIIGTWIERDQEFVQVREWCWETFGPGVERDLIHAKKDSKWGWHLNQSPAKYYIYLKDEYLTHFTLKWK
jgi:hypothetical protein